MLFFCFSLYAQHFYYYRGEKIFLTERTDKVFIKLSKNADKQKLLSSIQADEFVKLSSSDENLFDLFAILEEKEGKNISAKTLIEYRENPDVVSIQPLMEYKKGGLQGLIDEFVVKLKPTILFRQLQNLVSEYDCVIVEENQFVKNQYLIAVDKKSELNAMQMANIFYETELFEFSEPNFAVINAFNSKDPYFPQQWALKNTGQNINGVNGTPGIDIKAEQAWKTTLGSSNIKVAVIDNGVELTHPDLQSN